jgi:protein disulfide-isomerase
MKKIVVFLLFTFCVIEAQAQEQKWFTNVNEAMAVGNKENKPLLLFFTGSDWCGWCIRLQKEVLKTPEFATWAKQNVVLVELDYPRAKAQTNEIKQQNAQLQQIFGIQGYPTVHFATVTETKGKVNFQSLGNTGYLAGGPTAWLGVANGFLKKK